MKTLIQHGVKNGYFYGHTFYKKKNGITCFLEHKVFLSLKCNFSKSKT